MGIPTLINTLTADGDTSVGFTSGIDGTYDEYMFVFTEIHLNVDDKQLETSFSDDGGSSYGIIKTTTFFEVIHTEADDSALVRYGTGGDTAQTDAAVSNLDSMGDGADESGASILHLFNPASTTYVKHFWFTGTESNKWASAKQNFHAGYLNTTSAIDAIKWTGSAGSNFDGVIQMYGIA